ncbi:MAG TPA: hypothetical protein PLI59_23270, partial [Candidatus Obscuribacter sp.]|nr:hypothetical protein [Candidatus Obscuribacter sp.]
ATPAATLVRARDIALKHGLKYVYVGNVDDSRRQATYCPACKKVLIERNWYDLGGYHINDGACKYCREPIAGVWPVKKGTWGRRRQPVNIVG